MGRARRLAKKTVEVSVEYRLLVDLEVVTFLEGLPRARRHRLVQLLEKMRAFPSNYSDYAETDAIGRRVEVCIFSRWAIHFWIDAADRHVKVLAVETADV